MANIRKGLILGLLILPSLCHALTRHSLELFLIEEDGKRLFLPKLTDLKPDNIYHLRIKNTTKQSYSLYYLDIGSIIQTQKIDGSPGVGQGYIMISPHRDVQWQFKVLKMGTVVFQEGRFEESSPKSVSQFRVQINKKEEQEKNAANEDHSS